MNKVFYKYLIISIFFEKEEYVYLYNFLYKLYFYIKINIFL